MLIDIKKTAELLLAHDNYIVLSHANPDGDTLGSAHALCGILQRAGKKAKTLCADTMSPRMGYLKDAVTDQTFEVKTVVTVDVADKKLLGALEAEYGDRVLLAIDHHESREQFAEYTLLDPDAAAACEMIFDVAAAMGVQLDGAVAACIYTGIVTDTGCFKYSNTTARTHEIAAQLLKIGFNSSEINYNLFDVKSRGRIELEQDITNGMEFYCNDKIAMVCITLDLIKKHEGKVDIEDFNGLAGLPRQVEGVILGITIKQKAENVFKVSMRSAEPINAAKLCALFGGGGHARAAGCTIEGNLEFVKAKLLPVLEKAVEAV